MESSFNFEFDREEDGRWIADIPELPGVLAYGPTQDEARSEALLLASEVMQARSASSRSK
jgi:predicted RNase H-like HicB family nuclease